MKNTAQGRQRPECAHREWCMSKERDALIRAVFDTVRDINWF
jgi:hypothetical protein